MREPKPSSNDEYTFWTKYKRFASNELVMYAIMVVGIALGIFLISFFM